jgi:aminopeptidase N
VTASATSIHHFLAQHGDPTYDVQHYDLSLHYQVRSNDLRGRAVLDVVVRRPARELTLDLRGLTATKVTVDGSRPARSTHRRGRLVITLAKAARVDQHLSLAVTYHGHPTPVAGLHGGAGWEELHDGVIVASQPHGASSWFPCNDRPSDKASYRMEITATSGYHVVANGVLTARRRGASRTTWVFEQAEPMASYLATVQIGRYAETSLEGSPVPVTLVRPPWLAAKVDSALARQAEMVTTLSRRFGPYPFPAYTVVVTPDALEIPLEAQGMAMFGSNYMDGDWRTERLAAHELAHQWFGNSLTVARWQDIWLHEGFACYSEWIWSEDSGGRAADEHAREHWERLSSLPQDLVLAAPAPGQLFDDRVYKRGALALHALRRVLGDQAFFATLRSWVADHAYGSVTTAMFLDHVSRRSSAEGAELFDSWLFRAPLPPLPNVSSPQ